jgi:hypothetical protein
MLWYKFQTFLFHRVTLELNLKASQREKLRLKVEDSRKTIICPFKRYASKLKSLVNLKELSHLVLISVKMDL